VVEAWLGLGSNVGDRAAHLAHALSRLSRATELTGVSSVYETDPVGFQDQGRFFNMVARVETRLEPGELLALARTIEAERGRERTVRNGPRTLDIDLLLYGDRRIDQPGLTVPHPRMRDRPFVLVPLLELDPGLRDPTTGRGYHEALVGASGGAKDPGIRRVMAGTRLLAGEANGVEE
jgi:2-amino-4-hydroxy-6-hydroxymethyldihydropteridine diphosphokinase